MADTQEPPKDSLATRISKQFDQMIRAKAAQKGKEMAAQQEQQRQAEAQAQAQKQQQPQENRSTIEQIQQNKEATEKAAKDIDQY